jgi:hypothetical protein
MDAQLPSKMPAEPTAAGSTTEEAQAPSAKQTATDSTASGGTSNRPQKAPCYTWFYSIGSTVFNWKKQGNCSLPSPTEMVVKFPLNNHWSVAQSCPIAFAGIVSCRTLAQNLTAMGAAHSLMDQWHYAEYQTCILGKY